MSTGRMIHTEINSPPTEVITQWKTVNDELSAHNIKTSEKYAYICSLKRQS
jgi:hypothetical protein